MKVRVADILGGKENAKTGQEISKILNISLRDVCEMINMERHEGFPICANTSGENRGYYMAESREDVLRYCNSLKGRENEMHKVRKAMMKTLPNLPERNSSYRR